MIQIIMMARAYQRRPSEILCIDDEYVAYCIDEVAMLYVAKATDDKGNLKWNRLRWKDDERSNNKNNKELIEFIKKHG